MWICCAGAKKKKIIKTKEIIKLKCKTQWVKCLKSKLQEWMGIIDQRLTLQPSTRESK